MAKGRGPPRAHGNQLRSQVIFLFSHATIAAVQPHKPAQAARHMATPEPSSAARLALFASIRSERDDGNG